jgi:anthranilate phosphoribosyltransferase
MILVIDNYDSFTYNLVHLVAAEAEVRVVRNDALTVAEARALAPAGVLISPGPGRPADAGVSEALIRELGPTVPVFGVCLGHQAIGEVFGGHVVHAPTLMHGKTSRVRHDGRSVFEGVPADFEATRYHSLCVDPATIPDELEVSAWSADGVVMGLRHRALPVEGVQFHPESVLTVEGPRIVRNWVRRCLAPHPPPPGVCVIQPIQQVLAEGGTLTEAQAESAMHLMLRGEATPEQIAALLMGLRSRGETLDEIVGFTRVMREYAVKVDTGDLEPIDLCGTGGDHAGTFNISTAAAFVAAGAGVPVAKHGNRAVSSLTGSADVLDALGVRTDLGKEEAEKCLQQAGICFLLAPQFHPALRHVGPVRRALGVRTVFNVLGPLCNPAGVRRQLVGAFSDEVAQMMARVLVRLGSEHVVVVYAHDGLDELSTTSPTTVYQTGSHAYDGGMLHQVVVPEKYGLARVSAAALQGGSPAENAAIVRAVLGGETGPQADVVLLNAAYALLASAHYDSLAGALDAARESLRSGAALKKLDALVEASNAFATAA